jgi:hypothetical protein
MTDRIERILKGKFQLSHQLLLCFSDAKAEIIDYQHKEVVRKFQSDKIHHPLIISYQKVVFLDVAQIEIYDVITHESIKVELERVDFLDWTYNNTKEEILILFTDFYIKKSELMAYDLDGNRVLKKVIPFQTRLIAFGNYIFFDSHLTTGMLYDAFNYEFLGNFFIMGTFPLIWSSKKGYRFLTSPFGSNITRVYNPETKKQVRTFQERITSVINNNYGIVTDYKDKKAYFSLINLNTREITKLPASIFQSTGEDGDKILLIGDTKETRNVILEYDIKKGSTTNLFSAKRKLDYAFLIPAGKENKIILFCILRRRLESYLPLDLIRLTFDNLIS